MKHRVVLALALFLGLPGCRAAPAPPREPEPESGRPIYEGVARIDPAGGGLSASWRISFVPDSGTRDSVRLLLNSGLVVSLVGGSSVAGYSMNEDGLTVRFSPRLDPAHVATLEIVASGTPHFGGDGINGISAEWVELGLDSNWHPVFATYDQQISGTVRLGLPPSWQGVASGSVVPAGGELVLVNRIPLIDLAFAAAPAIRLESAGNASVHFVDADSATVARVLGTASSCASYLNARYGTAEPLPPVKIVLAPREGPGYARQNYIVITKVSRMPASALARFLCHELAHFWSSGAISLGPENWLNEGFAEFVAARFVREAFGDSTYQTIIEQWRGQAEGQPPVWTPELTQRPGVFVAYRKAPYLLDRLEERIGTDAMERVLQGYMTERLATTPALLEMVGRTAGAEHAAWFREQLAR